MNSLSLDNLLLLIIKFSFICEGQSCRVRLVNFLVCSVTMHSVFQSLWYRSALPHTHDDVIKWKHFPRYWPFVRGIHRSPHKGQGRGALMFSLICVWINGWVNNREAGDLRRYRAHHDVTVMQPQCMFHRCSYVNTTFLFLWSQLQYAGMFDTATQNHIILSYIFIILLYCSATQYQFVPHNSYISYR